MRKLVLVVLMLALGTNAKAIEPDKAAHFGLSYGIALTTTQLCKKYLRSKSEVHEYTFGENFFCSLTGGTMAIMVGAVKEAQDQRIDWQDMQANIYGATSATLLNFAFDF